MSTKEQQNITSLMDSGHVDEAEWLLTAQQQAHPDDADAPYLLARVYWKRNDWQGCMDSLNQAIALDPNSPAGEMRKMIANIIDSFYKEMYNP